MKREGIKLIFFVAISFFCGWFASFQYYAGVADKNWKIKHCLNIFSNSHKVDDVLKTSQQTESSFIEKVIITFMKSGAERKFVCTYNDKSRVWGAQEE